MRSPVSELALRWNLHNANQLGVSFKDAPLRSGISVARRLRSVQLESASNRAERRNGTAPSGRTSALRDRLTSIAPYLFDDWQADAHKLVDTQRMLVNFARQVRASKRVDHHWLFYVGISGAFPIDDSLHAFVRALELASDKELAAVCLEFGIAEMAESSSHYTRVHVVDSAVVADVDFCATHSFTSGIQRVVRNVIRRWRDQHDFELVAWTQLGTAFRMLTSDENAQVGRLEPSEEHNTRSEQDAPSTANTIVVPWRSVVFIPETSAQRFAPRQATLVQSSGNRAVAIAYDAIPLTSASFVSMNESRLFAAYLNVIKRSQLLLPISEATAEEFRGFNEALAAQALSGPTVKTITLPEAGVELTDQPERRPTTIPLVLSVGSFEVRKNQLATLNAAEILWRKGLNFHLVLVGGSAQPDFTHIDRRIAELVLEGRAISRLDRVDERTLDAAYRSARFSVFASLHEGYGLPVVESLAAGTPVVATSYGSVGEVAKIGGCLLVDPRDITSIASAMESLLTDDAQLEKLQREILARPSRTWENYADEVWAEIAKVRDAA